MWGQYFTLICNNQEYFILFHLLFFTIIIYYQSGTSSLFYTYINYCVDLCRSVWKMSVSLIDRGASICKHKPLFRFYHHGVWKPSITRCAYLTPCNWTQEHTATDTTGIQFLPLESCTSLSMQNKMSELMFSVHIRECFSLYCQPSPSAHIIREITIQKLFKILSLMHWLTQGFWDARVIRKSISMLSLHT